MTETQYLLTQLMEECAEVIHRCSKAIRFGLDEVQDGQTMTNAERIVYEMADLTTVAELLYETGCMPNISSAHITAKRDKIAKYMQHSRERGIL